MTVEINDSKTVLVVEDDQDMNELLCSILNEAGYHTVPVYDGEQSLEKVQVINPDLVLLDIMLPEMDGINVCRSICSDNATKDIPIIMVTAKCGLSTKLASYLAGARRFITKPFEVEDLLEEVNEALCRNKTA